MIRNQVATARIDQMLTCTDTDGMNFISTKQLVAPVGIINNLQLTTSFISFGTIHT